jgi:hypothetical protein
MTVLVPLSSACSLRITREPTVGLGPAMRKRPAAPTFRAASVGLAPTPSVNRSMPASDGWFGIGSENVTGAPFAGIKAITGTASAPIGSSCEPNWVGPGVKAKP